MKNFNATAILLILLLYSVATVAQDTKIWKNAAEAIVDGDEPEFSEAINYIKQNSPPEVVRFLKEEYLDDDDYKVRNRIITALKIYNINEYSDVWTVFLRNSEDSRIEIEIMEILGEADNNPFIKPLAEKLMAPRTEVRQKAAQVLKKAGDDKMLPLLLSLGNSSIPVNRIYFLEALNYLYDQRFQKTVISLLSDENKSVRIYALKCVLKNEIKEALPQVRNILKKDENNEVRKRGIELVIFFRDTSSGGILTDILDENDRELRLEAVKALADLRYSSAARNISKLLLKEQDEKVKTAGLDALALFKKSGELEGVEHVITGDPNPLLRVRAAYVLGEMKDDSRALGMLEASLTDKDYRVRSEACNSIGNFRRGNPSDILLKQISADSSRYVRTSALYALVRINDPKNLVSLFDIFAEEKDMVFRMILQNIIRTGMVKNIR